MKKTLSVFLAVLMLFSCFSVSYVSAADDGGYSQEEIAGTASSIRNLKVEGLPANFDCDIEGLKTLENGKYWNEINLLGMDLDFLYNRTDPVVWSTLDVYKTDDDGNIILGIDGRPIELITLGDVALSFSSVNAYVKNLYYSTYGGLKLYTAEKAVGLANVIGNIFYRDFEKLDPNNFTKLFGNETPNGKEFFEAVVELSKLDVLVQANWCSMGRSFCEPVVTTLTGDYLNIFNDDYANGKVLAAKTLQGLFERFDIDGPVKTIIDIIRKFAGSYESVYRTPTLALFTHKLEKITLVESVEKYETFSGLIELIFCNCDPLAANNADRGCFASSAENRIVDHFCPLDFPTRRILASDDDTIFMFLFYYLNLCGKHRGNEAYINNLKTRIDNSKDFNATGKARIKAILDGYFLNNIESTSNTVVTPHLQESFKPSADSLFDRIKNGLMVFLQKIADYFDYLRKLISGEIDYGQGNSPFG